MHRNESSDSLKDNKLKMKFQQVKKRLSSQHNLRNFELCKEKQSSPCTETQTFSERVSSYEQLLNSVKVSPLLNQNTIVLHTEDESS